MLFRRYGNNESLSAFRRLRSQIKSDIKIAFQNYINRIENNITSEPNKFWAYINGRKGTTSIPKDMNYNNEPLKTPNDIVDAFADFFERSYFHDMSDDPGTKSSNLAFDCLDIKSFSEAEVCTALKRLKPKFTAGPDGIPSFLLKDCASIFAYPLCVIFNLCLKKCYFPDIWKYSKVCPVYKKGERNDITNYRPITIICNFGKVFEFLLHDNIYSHVQQKISTQQHGFMKGRSTVTNLICATQYIAESIDNQIQVDSIYTDFSKAFDRLNHSKLLCKLDKFGISDGLLQFLESYLTNRVQFVSYNGYKSVEYQATSGVPQGSILGPLLFNIFINDISDNLDVYFLIYADDVKMLHRINDSTDCEQLQNNLSKLSAWCNENDLHLNVRKCNVMSYTTKESPIIYNYSVNGDVLNRPPTFKDLGVIFDNKLTFTNHIDAVISHAYRMLGFILRNSHDLNDAKTLKILYFAFSRSKLEYASLVWQSGYNTHNDKLENVQRRFLKFLNLKTEGTYPPIGTPQNQLLEKFDITSLLERRESSALHFLDKIMQNKIDCSEILNQLNFYVPRINSRHSRNFYLAAPRTNVLKFSPLFNICNTYETHCSELDIFA